MPETKCELLLEPEDVEFPLPPTDVVVPFTVADPLWRAKTRAESSARRRKLGELDEVLLLPSSKTSTAWSLRYG